MKWLIILLVMILVLYPILELTRVIIDWGLAPRFIFELSFMWITYLSIIPILNWRLK